MDLRPSGRGTRGDPDDRLPLVLEPQPEGGYVVTCPLVPELLTEGDTVQEARQNANDALEAVIEAYEDLGAPGEVVTPQVV
jgi:antitoxin HicB